MALEIAAEEKNTNGFKKTQAAAIRHYGQLKYNHISNINAIVFASTNLLLTVLIQISVYVYVR